MSSTPTEKSALEILLLIPADTGVVYTFIIEALVVSGGRDGAVAYSSLIYAEGVMGVSACVRVCLKVTLGVFAERLLRCLFREGLNDALLSDNVCL